MVYTFWGVSVQPQATPSETCLPHQLKITKATLDPVTAAKLPPGTRVSVWARQKMRPSSGALQPVSSKRSLVAVLVAAHRECVDTRCVFRNSSLVSFSISPQSHSCAVHLAGFFDDRSDAKPEETDDGTITWAELQELMANARGSTDDGDTSLALEEMREQLARAQADTDMGKDEPPSAAGGAKKGPGKRKKAAQQSAEVLDATKQARLDAIRAEAEKNEAAFTSPIASPISKHAKARTRKLAGGTQIADLAPGKGKAIKVGSKVTVVVVEQNAKGKTFGERKTINFVVGLKAVPSGLDRAVVGMRAGARALVSMEAGSNDRALAHWSQDQPLSLEVSVEKVA